MLGKFIFLPGGFMETSYDLSKFQDYFKEYVKQSESFLDYYKKQIHANFIPAFEEMMQLTQINLNIKMEDKVEEYSKRWKAAEVFEKLKDTYGPKLLGSAKYEGETPLGENELYAFNYIPAKKNKQKVASLFNVGGFIPYSDHLFRYLPEANLFDRFIENGIEVYEMKLKCKNDEYNPHLLNLTIAKTIESVHKYSDIAFSHNGNKKMILSGYCGTGINTYTSFLADQENMAKKFSMISTFVSPVDGSKCKIFDEIYNILENSKYKITGMVEGYDLHNVFDLVQETAYEKTEIGNMIHGWKNPDYADVNKFEDLTPKQRAFITLWYWVSLKHGSYYPLSKDVCDFYYKIFREGVKEDGILPYVYNGKELNLHDLKKYNMPVIVFLGDKDNLVVHETADILVKILGNLFTKILHEKTGHVAYILNPNRWNKNDPRAFKPDIIETILSKYTSV